MTTAPVHSPMRVWCDRHGAWLFGALALAPLVWCHAQFAELFWFGDDWDLLDEIARFGFWNWLWMMFTENFVPLFKLAWGGMVFAGGGSYFAMLVALWLTHALNVVLLGKLLRAEGFGWAATALVLAVFGLSWTNIETLGWSVQWSPVLAVTFLLAAANWHARHEASTRAWSWRVHGILAALVAASALSFSRGVVTGAALAAVSFVPIAAGPWRGRSRLLTAAVCLLPCAVVAALIYAFADGNHHDNTDGRELVGMARYALYYLGLNPLHRLLELESVEPSHAAYFGAVKLMLVVWCLRHSAGRVRRLLLLVLVLDLCNAALLGFGRYTTGIAAAVSSRYQYYSLLCTLPFVGYAFEAALDRWLGVRRIWRTALATLLALAVTGFVARTWSTYTAQWAIARGTYTRELLFENPDPPRLRAIPGGSTMTTRRAKKLIEIYHLH